MASLQDLREIYESFCSFGSNRNLATGSNTNLSGNAEMDGAKFSKLTRDCKIVDGKKVTTTDVDILFNQVKVKGARKIDWEGFQTAFQALAEKRFPSKNGRDAFDSLLHLVSDKAPIARATVTQTGGVYSKLTDTTQYTGSHKNRFDANGTGLGAAGRVTAESGTKDLSQLVNRETNFAVPNSTQNRGTASSATKKRQVTASNESLSSSNVPAKKQDSHTSNGSLSKNASKSTSSMHTSTSSLNRGSNSSINKPTTAGYSHTTTTTATKKAAPSTGGASVFDRLTNTSGYTGSHKERFNADGTGKGLAGRDTAAKGGSQDGLAKILRT